MNPGVILVWLLPLVILLLSSLSVSDTHILQSHENFSCTHQAAARKKNIGLKKKQTKLSMTVFYESLCGGCEEFFEDQFSSNWLPFYDYLNIILLPYGKATQSRDEKGNWIFTCQHGEDECYYNRIQVCAISKLSKDCPKKLFSFISCFESTNDKESALSQCADLIPFPVSKLETCAKSKEGFDLLAIFGDITHNFKPKLRWVPTIVFDGKFNQTESDLASSDLKSLLCEKLDHAPKICN